MSDPRPYVPLTGARLTYQQRVYQLREIDGERLLFNVQGTTEAAKPTYYLKSQARDGDYYYDVFSVRTGKRMPGQVTCFMRRLYPNRHTPKVPLWRWE